jgi:Translation initiation factor IF-2, N-terminal region.
MEKKKLKLSISGSSKKTIKSIEQAKSKSKNTVIIEKRPTRFSGKPQFSKQNTSNEYLKTNSSFTTKKNFFSKPSQNFSSDFEKRKLAEQRATRRLKGEETQKESRQNKLGGKRRELKLTVSRALSEDDIETKGRSLASLKRAKKKENRILNNEENKENLKPIKREVNIPEVITIRELANRMAEQSSNIIKHLLGMGVTVTINHTIDADTAEYLVKEFGHTPIKEERAEKIIEKIKEFKTQNLNSRATNWNSYGTL